MENLFVENDKIMSQADAMPTRESQKTENYENYVSECHTETC